MNRENVDGTKWIETLNTITLKWNAKYETIEVKRYGMKHKIPLFCSKMQGYAKNLRGMKLSGTWNNNDFKRNTK